MVVECWGGRARLAHARVAGCPVTGVFGHGPCWAAQKPLWRELRVQPLSWFGVGLEAEPGSQRR
eukprot:11491022-Prorocentrum_lima.AAC.1